ncbi:hypothetical protein Y032_0802g2426 [Ancylostoma ceylanicum]|uniref:Integrase catalytic domain-containing protein n=1 Tax=Ancylostoma ceylanicum TaxID=53326 RepID=A0A016WCJ7_9BILA|nr:hypothetical protein Y032_0802g2426 [Ancylostoma ceylanicum]
MDLVELGLTERGNKYALVVIDHFTKFLGAYPVPDKSARTVARMFFERWICEGCRWPKVVHSDQGPEFVNGVLCEICEITGIKQTMTKGYNPRENGMTERAIGTITRMLRKKTVIPADWDLLLPMVAFAYNSSPHDAIGESPFYMLHAFDPNQPSDVIPADQLALHHMDLDDYKHELLAAIKLGQECAKEINEKYTQKMKETYDRRNKVDESRLPRVGDRVYVKLPREKTSRQYPKLCDPWGGPYRVIETSNNSALLASINENIDPIRVQHDMLIVLPPEIDDTPVQTKTRRKSRQKLVKIARVNRICFRSRPGSDGDTSSLSIFFKCPNQRRVEGIDYDFDCSVRNMVFKDVVPEVEDSIGRLTFSNIFELARLISIFECERNADKKRFRMKDRTFLFITVTGIQKAFTFFKRHCDHVCRSLALHDGSPVMLPYAETTEIPIEQLNDLNSEGIKFAMTHSWSDVLVKEATQKILVLLPEGFRSLPAMVVPEDTVAYGIYQRFSEIPDMINRAEPRSIVFVGPTHELPLHRASWMKLAMTFAKSALAGAKVVVVAPPRGEQAWNQARMDAREMAEVARGSAMSMKHNIVCMIPLVESTTEPFQSMGLHPRSSATDTYPQIAMVDFMNCLREFVRAEVEVPEVRLAKKNDSRSNRNPRHGRHHSNDDISQRTRDGGVTKASHVRKTFRRNPLNCVVPNMSNNTNPNLMLSSVMPHLMYPQSLSFMNSPVVPFISTNRGRGFRSRTRRGRGGYPY